MRNSDFEVQWLLVLVLMTLGSAAVHLPSEVILPAGGWLLVREHDLGVPGVLAASSIAAAGNTIGSSLLYAAGRAGGRPLVRRYGRYFLLDEAHLDRAESHLRGRHTWAVLLARVLPVVRTYVGFCAGALRLPLGPFLSHTFIGSLVWCLPFVALGAALGSNWEVIQGPAKVAGIVALAGLLCGLVWLTWRSLRSAPTA